MFSFTEIRGQSSLLHPSGTVEFNTNCVAARKPAWWVFLKMLCVVGMIAIGYGITVPTFLELKFPLWQAIALGTAAMMIYTAIAFFIRPEANTDNMGWVGGMGNDPFQSADNVNRFLWKLHCLLGPGRFTSQTLLEFCVVLGIVGGDDVYDENAAAADLESPEEQVLSTAFDISKPIAPLVAPAPLPAAGSLSPNRFEQPAPSPFGGQQVLDSWKYLPAK